MASKQRTRLHEHSAENDMKYRGPLNYQHFQIAGWACIVMSVAVIVIKLGGKVDPGVTKEFGQLGGILESFSQFSLPFLLLASFAMILGNDVGFKKQLLKNGGAAVAIIVVTLGMGGRYFIDNLKQLVVQKDEVVPLITDLFRMVKPEGFLAFNLFVDLFLCTLTLYFLIARPKRVFTGKKLIIFRCFVILPIAYEIVCLVLKIQSALGKITLPLWSFPLLSMKPPVAILMFIFLCFLVKFREYRFCKHGRTHEEYQKFMQSNRNSFHLSVHMCISMIVFAVLDFILIVVLTYILADNYGVLSENYEIADDALITMSNMAVGVGIGEAAPMILVAPLMLLFSYNCVPKRKIISILVPAVAIVLSLLIVLEAGRMGIGMMMEGKQIDLDELMAMLMTTVQ